MSNPPEPDSIVPTGRVGDVGIIYPPTAQIEPFGDLSFMEAMSHFADSAIALQGSGCKKIFCNDIKSLNQSRAAVLGVRQAELPIRVSVPLSESGRCIYGSDPLSVLLTAAALGISEFSLDTKSEDVANEVIQRLSPLSEIPLFVGERPVYKPSSPTTAPDGDTIAVWETGFGWLSPELRFLEPVGCSEDMSEIILAAEEQSDVLLVRLNSVEDSVCLAHNAHMARLPVALLSDSEEVLEMALVLYCGRALIDSRCMLPREELLRLAGAYGAAVV